MREQAPGAAPGDHPSAIVGEIDRPAPRPAYGPVEDRKRKRRVDKRASAAKETEELEIAGEFLGGRQHLAAVAIELQGQSVGVGLGRRGPHHHHNRDRHGQPRPELAAPRAGKRQQAATHSEHGDRRRRPARPRPAHHHRREREQPVDQRRPAGEGMFHYLEYIAATSSNSRGGFTHPRHKHEDTKAQRPPINRGREVARPAPFESAGRRTGKRRRMFAFGVVALSSGPRQSPDGRDLATWPNLEYGHLRDLRDLRFLRVWVAGIPNSELDRQPARIIASISSTAVGSSAERFSAPSAVIRKSFSILTPSASSGM